MSSELKGVVLSRALLTGFQVILFVVSDFSDFVVDPQGLENRIDFFLVLLIELFEDCHVLCADGLRCLSHAKGVCSKSTPCLRALVGLVFLEFLAEDCQEVNQGLGLYVYLCLLLGLLVHGDLDVLDQLLLIVLVHFKCLEEVLLVLLLELCLLDEIAKLLVDCVRTLDSAGLV